MKICDQKATSVCMSDYIKAQGSYPYIPILVTAREYLKLR